MVNDRIGDTITRIRNAYKAGGESVVMPHAHLPEEVCKLLAKHGYLSDVATRTGKTSHGSPMKELVVTLAYKDNLPILTEIKRVSKPGRRVTVTNNQLLRVLDGYGIAVVSTSRGLLTDSEARKKHVGGEVLLTVW